MDRRLIYVNPALERLTGYTVEEVREKNFINWLHPEDEARLMKLWEELYKGKAFSGEEFRLVTKNGQVKWCLSSWDILYDERGQQIGIQGRERDITKRKQAEAALREREARLSAIYSAAPVGIGVDVNRVIQEVNETLCHITGYSREELVGQNSRFLFLTQEDHESVGREKYRLIAEHLSETVESRLKRKDGRIIDVLLSAVPLDAADLSQGVTFTVLDITERKQTEGQIQRRNEELAALNRIGQALSRLAPPYEIVELLYTNIGQVLDNRNLYIALYDEASQSISFPVYTINGERRTPASRPFGNGLTEYVIRTKAPLLIPRNQPAFLTEHGVDFFGTPSRCFLAVPMRAGERVTGVIAIQDYEREDVYDTSHMELLDTLASQAMIALENARLYSAVQQELDERKRVESQREAALEALAQERNLLRTLMDNLPDYIYVKDNESRFVLGNLALAHSFGAETPDEVCGKSDFDFHPPELAACYYADEQEILRAGQPLVNREEPVVETDGTRKWLLTTKVPLRDSQGEVAGLVGIGRDITERKQVEETVRQQLDELRRWHSLMLDREDRVQELKREVNKLLRQLDEPIRYPSVETQGTQW
jgi:PAS domain S-box-containing protein